LAYSRHFTLTTTRQLIVPVDGSAQEIYFHSESGTAYLGGSDVTSSNGFKVDNNEKIVFTVHPGDEIYGITSTGSTVAMLLVLVR
jgi:hypothetical protein